MKPKIHLVCNAHIDPVWLWRWNEGAAETVSTFRTAADFCEKYDGFVFNHNEALLYEWIEEYEPELFDRIKKLVKEGKWHIMGGWYLQPDCQLLSGESFIRQIEAGREYFDEKFSVQPTVAVNFDPFGHTRGLVQILNKTGYRGYVFMRIGPNNHYFKWKGFDGSEVVGHRIHWGYSTPRGEVKDKIESYLEEYVRCENPAACGMLSWGIGDHGGGASVPDIEAISKLIAETSDADIVQSDLETSFDEMNFDNLPVEDKSIGHVMVGCYTSMARIKQLHRRLESRINMCEKMTAHAAYACGIKFDNELEAAKKDLMLSQFHDVLPGSCIQAAEEDGIAMLNHGLTIADKLITKAFFVLCKGQQRPENDDIPIMVYNPHPYALKTDVEVEYCLANRNRNADEYTIGIVCDEDRNELPTQNEESSSSLNMDWRKKIVFSAELKPLSMNRFNCKLKVIKNRVKIMPWDENDDFITIHQPDGTVKISKKTGLIESYAVGGKEYLKNAGGISVIEDDEDPWGMTVDRFDKELGKMTLMSDYDANVFCGYPDETTPNVRVIENGAVRTVIQAFFEYGKNIAVVNYTIPKNSTALDVSVRLLVNDCNRMFKYNIDTTIENPTFCGQTAFGTQLLEQNGEEVVFQQWCGLEGENEQVCIINRDRYGGSCDGKTVKVSLLRTPIYSAHPIPDRQLVETNRYTPHMDLGERCFDFRIVCGGEDIDKDAAAAEFNQPAEALSFFPSGAGEKPQRMAEIDNKAILLTALKETEENTYLVRLYNSTDKKQKAEVKLFGLTETLCFESFEVRTFVYDGKALFETDMLGRK